MAPSRICLENWSAGLALFRSVPSRPPPSLLCGAEQSGLPRTTLTSPDCISFAAGCGLDRTPREGRFCRGSEGFQVETCHPLGQLTFKLQSRKAALGGFLTPRAWVSPPPLRKRSPAPLTFRTPLPLPTTHSQPVVWSAPAMDSELVTKGTVSQSLL